MLEWRTVDIPDPDAGQVELVPIESQYDLLERITSTNENQMNLSSKRTPPLHLLYTSPQAPSAGQIWRYSPQHDNCSTKPFSENQSIGLRVTI